MQPHLYCHKQLSLQKHEMRGILQFGSVTQSCLPFCNPMDCSTPGLPVHHQLPEFTQTHVHRVGDAIQPSHPLSSPSPPTFYLSQHQGLFQKWVTSSHQVAKVFTASVLPINIQGWFHLGWTGLISFQSNGLSRVFSNITVQKHQFFSIKPSVWSSFSHPYMTTGKTSLWFFQFGILNRWLLYTKILFTNYFSFLN